MAATSPLPNLDTAASSGTFTKPGFDFWAANHFITATPLSFAQLVPFASSPFSPKRVLPTDSIKGAIA